MVELNDPGTAGPNKDFKLVINGVEIDVLDYTLHRGRGEIPSMTVKLLLHPKSKIRILGNARKVIVDHP